MRPSASSDADVGGGVDSHAAVGTNPDEDGVGSGEGEALGSSVSALGEDEDVVAAEAVPAEVDDDHENTDGTAPFLR